MRHKVWGAWVAVCAVLGTGCEPSPEDTVEKMRRRACEKDAAGFFEHVDKPSLSESLKALVAQLVVSPELPLYPVEKSAAVNRWLKEASGELEGLDRKLFERWAEDIELGERSDLCRMEVIAEWHSGDRGGVALKTPIDGERAWYFSKRGERWLLTDIQAAR